MKICETCGASIGAFEEFSGADREEKRCVVPCPHNKQICPMLPIRKPKVRVVQQRPEAP